MNRGGSEARVLAFIASTFFFAFDPNLANNGVLVAIGGLATLASWSEPPTVQPAINTVSLKQDTVLPITSSSTATGLYEAHTKLQGCDAGTERRRGHMVGTDGCLRCAGNTGQDLDPGGGS